MYQAAARSRPRLQLQKDVRDINKWFHWRPLSIFNPLKKQGLEFISSCEMCLFKLAIFEALQYIFYFFCYLFECCWTACCWQMHQQFPCQRSLTRSVCIPFKVFPPVRQPGGAQPDGAGRQPGLHEVDGRGRSGRLTPADLSEDPRPGGGSGQGITTRVGSAFHMRWCSESCSLNPLMYWWIFDFGPLKSFSWNSGLWLVGRCLMKILSVNFKLWHDRNLNSYHTAPFLFVI